MNEHTPLKIAAHIEALLFALGRPVSKQKIAKKLQISEEEIRAALLIFAARDTGGITLIDDGTTLELRTGAETAELVEQIQKEEYARDIGKAGLEALAAILYRGPLTRAEVDFIRGVNSTQTLRTLTMRGLVRKIPNPKDERSFLYEPTTEAFAELGIHSKTELPDYAATRAKLEQLEAAYRAKEDEAPHTS
ncbi:MAG TPA: SMC-Scp complex subunit ScpB [Candidatus Paceibacterota bacterium]|nr:SMC-Scp complex subunit ScpB [Candidatus Paceibacterota bacterium]